MLPDYILRSVCVHALTLIWIAEQTNKLGQILGGNNDNWSFSKIQIYVDEW